MEAGDVLDYLFQDRRYFSSAGANVQRRRKRGSSRREKAVEGTAPENSARACFEGTGEGLHFERHVPESREEARIWVKLIENS